MCYVPSMLIIVYFSYFSRCGQDSMASSKKSPYLDSYLNFCFTSTNDRGVVKPNVWFRNHPLPEAALSRVCGLFQWKHSKKTTSRKNGYIYTKHTMLLDGRSPEPSISLCACAVTWPLNDFLLSRVFLNEWTFLNVLEWRCTHWPHLFVLRNIYIVYNFPPVDKPNSQNLSFPSGVCC